MKTRLLVVIVAFVIVVGIVAGVVYYLGTQQVQRGDQSNPATIGEHVTAKIERKTFEVTVLDFVRGTQVYQEMKDDSWVDLGNGEGYYMTVSTPREGFEYLMVDVRVKYMGGEGSAYITDLDFGAYAEGVGYHTDLFLGVGVKLPEHRPELSGDLLITGGVTEGWMLFEVPQNKEILIAFEYWETQQPTYDHICFINIGKSPTP